MPANGSWPPWPRSTPGWDELPAGICLKRPGRPHPVLYVQPRNTPELFLVMGNQDPLVGKDNGGNDQIIGSDGCSGRFKGPERDGFFSHPGKNRTGGKEAEKYRFPAHQARKDLARFQGCLYARQLGGMILNTEKIIWSSVSRGMSRLGFKKSRSCGFVKFPFHPVMETFLATVIPFWIRKHSFYAATKDESDLWGRKPWKVRNPPRPIRSSKFSKAAGCRKAAPVKAGTWPAINKSAKSVGPEPNHPLSGQSFHKSFVNCPIFSRFNQIDQAC